MPLRFNKNVLQAHPWTPPTGRRGLLRLDLNENDALPDAKLLAKLKRFDRFVVNAYPEYESLIKLLAHYAAQPKKNILITNGADSAIELCLRVLFNKKSRVVMPSPVFTVYDHVLGVIGARVRHIPYEDRGVYFKFPLARTREALRAADGIVLCNPSNPLGSAIPEAGVRQLLRAAANRNIPCIIDEAYAEFYGHTSAPLMKRYPNLIIIKTFSKAFGLAGLRLGYVLADAPVVEQVAKLRLPWSANHFAVFAAELALKNRTRFLGVKLRDARAVKKNLTIFLRAQGIHVYDTETNFILVKTRNSTRAMRALYRRKILVNDVSHYPWSGALLKNIIRVTIPEKKDLERTKKGLRAALQ